MAETPTVPPETALPETTVAGITVAETSAPAPPNYVSGSAARVAMDAVAAEVGGAAFQAVQIVLYPRYVISQVQHPVEPTFVDRVVWRDGAIATREPVPIPPIASVDELHFTLDDVSWEAVDALVAATLAQTGVHDGEVSHIVISRPLHFSSDVQFRVFVTGPRSSGHLDAAADGTVLAVASG